MCLVCVPVAVLCAVVVVTAQLPLTAVNVVLPNRAPAVSPPAHPRRSIQMAHARLATYSALKDAQDHLPVIALEAVLRSHTAVSV